MLGINLLFAGFALCLNGISYKVNISRKMLGYANLMVGIIIFLNSVIGVIYANSIVDYANAAGGFLFALNYILIYFTQDKAESWKMFGFYELFASIVCLAFVISNIISGGFIMVYLWAMWMLLWLEGFLDAFCEIKGMAKVSPIILIVNGIASTFIPGLLILFGII